MLHGSIICSSNCFNLLNKASGFANSFRAEALVNCSVMWVVAATPMSALNNMFSICSSRSSSMFFLPRIKLARFSLSFERVRFRPCVRLENRPFFFWGWLCLCGFFGVAHAFRVVWISLVVHVLQRCLRICFYLVLIFSKILACCSLFCVVMDLQWQTV